MFKRTVSSVLVVGILALPVPAMAQMEQLLGGALGAAIGGQRGAGGAVAGAIIGVAMATILQPLKDKAANCTLPSRILNPLAAAMASRKLTLTPPVSKVGNRSRSIMWK